MRVRQIGRAERVADIASWIVGGLGVATIFWCFQDPAEGGASVVADVSGDERNASTSRVPSEPEEVSRWMRRASEGGGVNNLLNRAQVGPWAKDQKASDNDVPARVPKN
tara:strand:- start:163 stop:489 length:327 start_codon:yes stop_codon:yes gene_type:complete